MLERLKRNKRVVKLLQEAFPDDARCGRCGLPVSAAGEIHYIDISGAHASYFVCCEHCWSKMSYVEKVTMTASLYSDWVRETGKAPYDFERIVGSLQDDVARNLLERKV